MSSIAVSSKTKYPEAAWEFLKQYLDDDMQYKHSLKREILPVTPNALDKYIDYYTENGYTFIEDERKIEFTREEFEDLFAYFANAKSYNYQEYDVLMTIIEEEMSYDKPPEEIAKVIQSRTFIYINEKRHISLKQSVVTNLEKRGQQSRPP
jgi:ABC-type glycerol-3-phosphate transport system substrate-binding protein